MIVSHFYAIYFLIKTNAKLLNGHEQQYGYNGIQRYVASIDDVPYHVVIAYRNLYCSGSILRSKVVVTAASCLAKRSSQRVVVKVGANTVTGLGQVIEAMEVKSHEYFGHTSALDNDISLLYLQEHIIFGLTSKKILLVQPNFEVIEGIALDVSGWGNMEHAPKYANSLLWSEMIVISSKECRDRYPYLMTESNFCVRYLPERRLSDNGGPATFRGLLAGVLSYGASAQDEPYVAIITNVSYFHKWITLNTKRFMLSECLSPQYNSDLLEFDYH